MRYVVVDGSVHHVFTVAETDFYDKKGPFPNPLNTLLAVSKEIQDTHLDRFSQRWSDGAHPDYGRRDDIHRLADVVLRDGLRQSVCVRNLTHDARCQQFNMMVVQDAVKRQHQIETLSHMFIYFVYILFIYKHV